jgi:hypothetical protein
MLFTSLPFRARRLTNTNVVPPAWHHDVIRLAQTDPVQSGFLLARTVVGVVAAED